MRVTYIIVILNVHPRIDNMRVDHMQQHILKCSYTGIRCKLNFKYQSKNLPPWYLQPWGNFFLMMQITDYVYSRIRVRKHLTEFHLQYAMSDITEIHMTLIQQNHFMTWLTITGHDHRYSCLVNSWVADNSVSF